MVSCITRKNQKRRFESCSHAGRLKIALGGRYSRDCFNRYGDLRHIRRLRFWPLNKVLMEKYDFNEQDATNMADFLIPTLDFVPEKRPPAAQLLLHPWIDVGPRLHQLAEPSDGVDLEKQKKAEEKQKKDKDEGEAMATEMGNIAIDISFKIAEDAPQPNTKP